MVARSKGGTAPVLVPGGQPGSLIHSSNGFGSSSAVPGLTSRSSSGLAAVQGDGSSAPLLTVALAVVVLLAGAFLGARAWRKEADAPPSSASLE